MAAYYNESDKFAAQWLRNLIDAGHIAPGVVDERSVEDVEPRELVGFRQCHFFAGLGGWSYALRRAGWPDDREVWTGSCPCQPFSKAGKKRGADDERHLWPAFFHLIRECCPATVFGEQVADASAEAWLDLVQSDMEGVGYLVGALSLPAAGFGAPHKRGRLYWLGHSILSGLEGHPGHGESVQARPLAAGSTATASALGRMDDTQRFGWREGRADNGAHNGLLLDSANGPIAPGPTNGIWRAADWLRCTDERWRPVEPGTFPLVDGAPARVGRLRAYGNAIVPEVAAEFVAAYLECLTP